MADLDTNFESDALLKLLTDALRAGPASPQWHDAVARLKSGQDGEVDEYRLLMEARENLESGREYRSVRAGPGFTRKVMEGIENEAAGNTRARPGLASWLAIFGGLAALAGLVVLIVIIARNSGPTTTDPELASVLFTRPQVTSDFADAIPTEWQEFGLAPKVQPRDKALHASVQKDDREFRRGGIVLKQSLPPTEPFALEASVRARGNSPDIALRLFIADRSNWSEASQDSMPAELVLQLREGQWSVFDAKGSQVGKTSNAKSLGRVLIKMDRKNTLIEVDGTMLYAGPHGLRDGASRYPGIRFLSRGVEKAAEDISVVSVRVLKP